MNTLEIYKQEIETELDHALEKLDELKAKIRGLSDVERIQSFEDVEELENIASDMRIKISELSVDMEDAWDQIKSDIDNSRNKINEAFVRLNKSLV